MKLIVGLGNPGMEYQGTRHNIGFMILDEYLKNVEWKEKFESKIYSTDIFDEQVIFVKPLTYMNLSGNAVQKIVNFYKIDIEDILIIQDDLDLNVGSYKIKRNSSSGGHNGIKSIISMLNTDKFARLKIGIGKPEQISVEKYVLSKFTKEELNNITNNMDIFKNIIDDFIKYGIEKVMELYNKK